MVSFKETVVISIVLEPNRNPSLHWFVSPVLSFRLGLMNFQLPQEHKGGWGSQRRLRTEPPPQTHTLILQFWGFKTQGFELLTGKSIGLSEGKFYTQGILPRRGRSYCRKIHSVIYKIINEDFLKHLLCARHCTNHWVVEPKQTWPLRAGRSQPSEILLSWSTYYVPDILLGPLQTLSH